MMLVLSRKLGEKIVINGNIVVTVVKIDRNQIRLGIEAPKDVAVYREEIAPGVEHVPAASVMTR
jgi:carbon storage regulator